MCRIAQTDGAQAAGAGIMVQPCSAANAAGDGREHFSWEDCQIVNISGNVQVDMFEIAVGDAACAR